MAKKVPQPRSKQLPTRLGNLNTMRLTERLRELHRLGDDPRLEQFPDPAELFLVLRHAEQMASQLTQPANSPINVVGEAALLRAQMWQYLREQAELSTETLISPVADVIAHPLADSKTPHGQEISPPSPRDPSGVVVSSGVAPPSRRWPR